MRSTKIHQCLRIINSMRLGQHQEIFAQHLAMLIIYAASLGYGVRVGEVHRPRAVQKFYVQTGKSKTMNSTHIKKCGADLFFQKDGKITYPIKMGLFWESLDPLNKAGMFWKNFKDGPHFQRSV